MSSASRRCSFDAVVALAVVLFICVVPGRAAAQVLYGSILGDVKDSSGAAMPGATVLVTNNRTGLKREAVTDGVGHFNLADLPAGVYSFKATQQGFKTFEQTAGHGHHQQRHARRRRRSRSARWATPSPSRAEPPKLQTETAEVHANLLGAELTNLPVPLGRNYQQVYRMLPGFAPPANSHSIPTNPARSLEFTVNGTSDDQNNTRIDGVSTANIQLPHVVLLHPDARVDSGGQRRHQQHDAEQGLAGGAAINVQTRSGANAIHGSGFEYFTNQHLKAWPMRFDDAALNTGPKPRPELQRVRRHRRRADQEEQGVLLRQLRVHPGPQGGRQTPCRCRCRRCCGATCRSRRRRFTTRSREMRTAPGGRSSRCSPATRTTRCATRPPTRTA